MPGRVFAEGMGAAMLVDVVRTMYRYTDWANQRIFDSAERLTPEQFTAPDDTPFGSIRNTLVHMVMWQCRWLSWWDGTASTSAESLQIYLDPDDYLDVESVREEWQALHAQTELFLSQLTEDRLNVTLSATSSTGADWTLPLWVLMMQVANHGTQHRAEVAMKLSGFGHSPGNLDIYFYALETGVTAPS